MTIPKIFCIGLGKTGTVSLSEALTRLGFDARHEDHTARCDGLSTLPADDGRFDDADAFLDWPIRDHWRDLLRLYPDAMFILTTRRDVEEWLTSNLIHVLSNRLTNQDPWQVLDMSQLRQQWHLHHREVRETMDSRSNYLEIPLEHPDKWGLLCGALGAERASGEWPCLNTGIGRLWELAQQRGT